VSESLKEYVYSLAYVANMKVYGAAGREGHERAV